MKPFVDPIVWRDDLTPAENAQWVVEEEDRRRNTVEAKQSRFLHKCLCLATSWEVFEALVRGESVPIGRLNPEYVQRFGLRAYGMREIRAARAAVAIGAP